MGCLKTLQTGAMGKMIHGTETIEGCFRENGLDLDAKVPNQSEHVTEDCRRSNVPEEQNKVRSTNSHPNSHAKTHNFFKNNKIKI